MPSFDIVCELDQHEVANAIDQANREIGTRFDFKDVDASYAVKDNEITLTAESKFQLAQMLEILRNKLAKRQIDMKHLEEKEPTLSGKTATQIVTLQEGIPQDKAKNIIKQIKDQKFKVQAAIQGDQVRVTGKKRDDLQEVMAHLRKAELELPVQFTNFRD